MRGKCLRVDTRKLKGNVMRERRERERTKYKETPVRSRVRTRVVRICGLLSYFGFPYYKAPEEQILLPEPETHEFKTALEEQTLHPEPENLEQETVPEEQTYPEPPEVEPTPHEQNIPTQPAPMSNVVLTQAELSRLISDAVAAAINAHTAAQPAAAPSAPKEVRLRNPDVFNGDRTKSKRFMADIDNYQSLNPSIYDTDEKKIAYALSYMRGGTAGPWAQVVNSRGIPSPPRSLPLPLPPNTPTLGKGRG